MSLIKPAPKGGTHFYTFADGSSYSGEWLDGKPHGEGSITWSNGCTYKGFLENGKRQGQGECIFPGGEIYEGGWHNDKMHGEGTLIIGNRRLTGKWTNGMPEFAPPKQGRRKYIFPDGKGVYDGDWLDGKRHGEGTFQFKNKDHYVGHWDQGEIHGEGLYTFKNGDTYKGRFNRGILEGEGVYTWTKQNQKYSGHWKNGKRHGKGTHYFDARNPNGDYVTGNWNSGKMQGPGKYFDIDGKDYTGEWVDGMCPEIDFNVVPESGNFRYQFVGGTYDGEWKNKRPHGYGTMTYDDGVTHYEGEWKNFMFHGHGRLTTDKVVYDGEWRDGRQHGRGVIGPAGGMAAAQIGDIGDPNDGGGM